MRTGQEHFDPDQAELLLYAAGELSEDRQRDIDERLIADAEFRTRLDAVRNEQEMVFRCLADLDAIEPVVSSASLERLVAKAVKQRRVEQLTTPAIRPVMAASRSGWGWIHTAATAASILIGLVLWWGMRTRDVQLAGISRPSSVLTDGLSPTQTALPTGSSISDIASDDAMFAQAEDDLDAVASLRSLTETVE